MVEVPWQGGELGLEGWWEVTIKKASGSICHVESPTYYRGRQRIVEAASMRRALRHREAEPTSTKLPSFSQIIVQPAPFPDPEIAKGAMWRILSQVGAWRLAWHPERNATVFDHLSRADNSKRH